MHKFYCQHCGQHIETEDSLAGMQAQCPSCSKEITIPSNTKTIREEHVNSAITPDFDQRLSKQKPIISKNNKLGLFDGYNFPDNFCIKCCKPSVTRKQKSFSYTPPALLLLIIMPVVLIIVMLFFTKNRLIHYGLCREHNEFYKKILIAKWSVFGVISFLIFLICVNDGGGILGVLLLVAIVSFIGLFCIPCPISITKMRNGYTYFRGGSNKIINTINAANKSQ